MKNLKQSARHLNTILNIIFWFVLLRGIYATGYHSIVLYRLFTDPAALTEKMGLTIDWLTLDATKGFGISLDAAIKMKLIQLISAAVITVIACLAIRVLKRILLPIEVGQPFRTGISAHIVSMSKCAFWLGLAENLSMLASVIVIENHYDLPALLMGSTVTGVSIHPRFRPVWFIVAAVLSILAMVFRQGEQLQQLADETL